MKKLKLHSKLSIFLVVLVIVIVILSIFFFVVNNNKGYKKDIRSIKIRYAYAYNVQTADDLNEINEDGNYIDILEVNLEKEELCKIKSLIEKLSFREINNLDLVVIDTYQVVVNDDYKLYISPSQDYACYIKGNNVFIIEISEELINEIEKIVQKNVSKTIEYSSDKLTISKVFYEDEEEKENAKDIEITNPKHIETILESVQYSKVNITEEELAGEEIEYIVDFNNGLKICTYYASILGYILDENNDKTFIAFNTDFDYMVQLMYENYISGRNDTLKASEIVVKYKDKEVKITESEKVEEIIEKLKMCSYFSPDYLEDFGTSDYSSNDILIEVGKFLYIIPGEKTMGNRYYIDENKKAYLVTSLRDLESYFKELVGYQD